ncbi:MAG: SGNH/GDSL hydrolase family protein [Gammaproteobacteria bacterium]
MNPARPDATPDRPARRGGLVRLVAINLLVCALLLLAAEAAVRVRATLRYGTTATAEDLYRIDEATGLRVARAGLVAGPITTNSLGFRGPEISVPKPGGTLRLAFLGASTTWCAEVSGNDSTWPHIVTEGLRARVPNHRWDYVNAAVPGYTVETLRLNLQRRVAALQPDVIIVYEATNDMSGELREIAFDQGVLGSTSFRPPSWPARYSLLWELVEKNLRIMAAQWAARDQAARLRLDPQTLGEDYRRELTALIREARQHARIVAVATFSTQLRRGQSPGQQERASGSAMYYMPFMSPQGLIDAYERYNTVIREVAAETGALLIDEADAIPGTPEYFVDTVHFSDAGSRAMAERVLRALRSVPWEEIGAGP